MEYYVIKKIQLSDSDLMDIQRFDHLFEEREVCTACDIGNLTDEELSEFLRRVTSFHPIEKTDQWNSQYKSDPILLLPKAVIEKSDLSTKLDFQRLCGPHLPDDLYIQDQVWTPIKCCRDLAEEIRSLRPMVESNDSTVPEKKQKESKLLVR